MSNTTEQHTTRDNGLTIDGTATRLDPESVAGTIAAGDAAAEEMTAADNAQVNIPPGGTGALKPQTIITPKDFIPGRDNNWILMNLIPQALGTRIFMGSLLGKVTSTERKTHMYMDKPLESIWLNGTFEATVGHSGEVIAGNVAILPRAMGQMIEQALKLEPGLVAELDVDIGLERISRGNVNHQWIVMSYDNTAAQRALADLKRRQAARIGRGQSGFKSLPPTIEG